MLALFERGADEASGGGAAHLAEHAVHDERALPGERGDERVERVGRALQLDAWQIHRAANVPAFEVTIAHIYHAQRAVLHLSAPQPRRKLLRLHVFRSACHRLRQCVHNARKSNKSNNFTDEFTYSNRPLRCSRLLNTTRAYNHSNNGTKWRPFIARGSISPSRISTLSVMPTHARRFRLNAVAASRHRRTASAFYGRARAREHAR
mmetsp:Transcript_11345/g.30571  ORF Transcript_11345/g.30571 Transcript_11345/m.30571 type:complete len:206 (+) Transcript_11345:164-781(+)